MQGGFTLVEMIVVVGIIALLLALLMAAVVRSRVCGKSIHFRIFRSFVIGDRCVLYRF